MSFSGLGGIVDHKNRKLLAPKYLPLPFPLSFSVPFHLNLTQTFKLFTSMNRFTKLDLLFGIRTILYSRESKIQHFKVFAPLKRSFFGLLGAWLEPESILENLNRQFSQK